MSDNQKIRRRQRCPKCGSLYVIKWGVRDGAQRFKMRYLEFRCCFARRFICWSVKGINGSGDGI